MAGAQSRFAFVLPAALHDALRAAATGLERSEAWIARTALREWLAHEGEPVQDAREGASTPESAPADPYARFDPDTAALLRRVDAQLADGDPSYAPPGLGAMDHRLTGR